MRVVLLSRPFNRAGLDVLEALASAPDCELAAVVLPPLAKTDTGRRRLDRSWSAPFEKARYRLQCRWQGAAPLRFEASIRRRAEALGIPVELVSSFAKGAGREFVRRHAADLIVIGGGWPRLLPIDMIESARFGGINVHPSLLPAFRGTDVHRWQIAAGAGTSGVTVHTVDAHFDSGRPLAQAAFDLEPGATPQSLARQAAERSGELVAEVLRGWPSDAVGEDGSSDAAEPTEIEDDDLHGRWPWGDAAFLALDASRPAEELERFVRAATQESFEYDGPWLEIDGDAFVVRAASLHPGRAHAAIGEIAPVDGWPVLQCAEAALRLDRIQPRRPVPNRTRCIGGRTFARRRLQGRTLTAKPVTASRKS